MYSSLAYDFQRIPYFHIFSSTEIWLLGTSRKEGNKTTGHAQGKDVVAKCKRKYYYQLPYNMNFFPNTYKAGENDLRRKKLNRITTAKNMALL